MATEKKYTLSQLKGAWAAGKHSNDEERHPLLDKWVHTKKDGDISWQGHIESQVSDDTFLVQWYSWLTGSPTNQTIVPISEMADWDFYATWDAWDYAASRFWQRLNAKQGKG